MLKIIVLSCLNLCIIAVDMYVTLSPFGSRMIYFTLGMAFTCLLVECFTYLDKIGSKKK